MKRIIQAGVFMFSLVLIFPLFWMASGSFKGSVAALRIPPELIPAKPTLRNYEILFQEPVLRWTVNSFLVAGGSTIGCVLLNAAAGYGFEKKQFRGKEILFWVFLLAMMIPTQITLVPIYLMVRRMGIYDSLWALIIPFMHSSFLIFFYRRYLKDFPDEFLHSADMDGAGELRKFFQIVLPLTRPALATMAILSFMGQWNNFLWQLILIHTPERKTLVVGITELVWAESKAAGLNIEGQSGVINYGLIAAGATYSFLPMLVVFLLFQKTFIRSLYTGGIK